MKKSKKRIERHKRDRKEVGSGKKKGGKKKLKRKEEGKEGSGR